ncbi:RHO1 GDP-GTP exchange protein 2 [Steccherinum ochraceum]|uniref:RHO1 GDP-GTP exchange protein 2 n=1 Tax=Steccherinum ochraceum TaxID=92696 RepID=A0A4R0RF33_9APHY|nr:RHO1 GDP-GTP exchange protein 2 [Steccherinum ochraceum]
MERPMGPRQPDKRNAAYESIFGRPSASHHIPGQPYPQPPPQASPFYQGNGQHSSQQYGAQLDRRTSYASVRTNSTNPHYTPSLPPVPGPGPYRQPPFPTNPPSQHSHISHAHHSSKPSASLTPPSVMSRARSIGHAPGTIRPAPEEPPDPGLEALQRAGLTPAQALQAQYHSSQPNGKTSNQVRAVQQQNNYERRSLPVQGELPRLGVNIDANGGRLDIDFSESSEAGFEGTDDGSTELPWGPQARSKPNSVRSRLSVASGFSPIYEQQASMTSPSSSASSRYPLQLDTAMNASSSSQMTGALSTSPSSSIMTDLTPGPSPPPPGPSGRRSSESSKTLPGPHFRRDRGTQDRSRSMSAAIAGPPYRHGDPGRPRPPIPSLPGGRDSPARNPAPRRGPVVYPALLSRVAQAFKDRIQLADRIKDGLTYKDAFDGREAVDKIAYIIKTTDRNLALLYGRALDAQKFFHAVTYDHRLRDSANDLYQFRTKLPSPFVSGELGAGGDEHVHEESARPLISDGRQGEAPVLVKDSPTPSAESSEQDKQLGGKDGSRPTSPSPPESVVSPTSRPRRGSVTSDDVPLPSGVFTLLTDCYSPTCSRDQLCYSIACPRRLEQQARLNMKPQPGLKKEISKESLGELVVQEPGTLWIHSVPQEVVNSVSDTEKKRQEAINEVIYTERDFVRDMEYLRDLWVKPLQESEIIPASRRQDFIEQVFWNVNDIIAVNTRLRDALNKRQKSYAVVEQVADILLDAFPHFAPFVSYGAHQLYGKYEFEKEKSSNLAFAQFVEETERRPESRKLELNGYLTKPTTRLARYPLLLEAVLKHTSDDNPDKAALPKAVELVRALLRNVNEETGKAENRFNLLQLDSQLIFRPGEQVNLRLKEEGRELVYKGPLKKRGNAQGDSAELQLFLFDHALLMVKQKTKSEQYKVYRPPIPLELLVVSAPDDFPTKANPRQKQMLTKNAPHAPVIPVNNKDGKGGFSITFVHLGKKYYSMTLWASTYVNQRKWVESILKQQDMMRERSLVFETLTLSESFFIGSMRVNCAAPFSQGRRVVYGTDDGVYLSNLLERNREPVKVLALQDVSQVDVLEDYQLLIVLSERQVLTFPLDALDPMDPMSGLKRAKRIASHISFFKAGICLGKTVVCVVKASPLSSTIKTFEPIDQNIRGRAKPTFKKLLQGGNDTLRVFKEFYIPVQSSSIHFLKTRLCVGTTNGFEIVDLETLDTQGLLDPADGSLEFVRKRENLRPLAIYRIDNEFLLCYDEFAFYVNKTGWRSRKHFMVYWEGTPSGFALHYPYVLAFEPTFVEVRHVETGSMSQIIQGNNLRLLFADTPPSTTNTAVPQYYNPYQQAPPPQQQQYGGGGYNNAYGGQLYDNRQSLPNGYGAPSPMQLSPYGAGGRSQQPGRDEILLVSDDRVMRLQLGPNAAQQLA